MSEIVRPLIKHDQLPVEALLPNPLQALTGELLAANPDIPRLPLPPVSPGAQDFLTQWGLTPAEILELQAIASLFRYDLCPYKVKRLVAKPAVLYEFSQKRRQVELPNFYNFSQRLDGQCMDITVQLQRLLESTYGSAPGETICFSSGAPFDLCHVVGQSPTHFNGAGDTHVWLGIKPQKEGYQNMVILDASFQQLTTFGESAYKTMPAYVQTGVAHTEPMRTAASVNVTTHMFSEDGYDDIARTTIIGVTADRRFSVALAFIQNERWTNITPYIILGRANSALPFTSFGKKGDEIYYDGPTHDLEGTHWVEVLDMLGTLNELTLERQ